MRRLALVVLAACGGGGSERPDAPAPLPLVANAGADVYAVVGIAVELDGSASTGAVSYAWNSGDGQEAGGARAELTYAAPGRYQAVLTVTDAAGATRTDAALVSVTWPLTWQPTQTSTIVHAFGSLVVAVSTDTDEQYVMDVDEDFGAEAIAVCDSPRTVTWWASMSSSAVACDEGDAVDILFDGHLVRRRVSLPRGSRPFAAAARGDVLWVTLGGTGQLARIERSGTDYQVTGFWRAIPDARGIAVWPDGRIAVSRWRSPDDGGVIALIDPAGPPDADPELVRLAVDPQAGSDTELGGVPSYLEQILVSPNRREAALPSLQANILEGTFRSNRPLTFETTVRAVVSWLDVAGGAEDFDRRKQFDDRGRAAGAVFTSRGDYLFVAMPGNRTVERLDVLGGGDVSGTLLDVGHAVDGVALAADRFQQPDRLLAVLAPLSREVVVYDVASFDQLPQPRRRIALTSAVSLDPVLQRGKQLFHDATDERLAKDGYVACAHCHLDGLSDSRTWDFTDRGEGLRNTTALGGRTAQGLLHWSANFDEVQDFEHDLRGPFGGRGLLADDVFHTGTRDTPLGDPKAGLSADLDALAAYVASLREPRSPHRNADGTLPAAAARGRAVFASLGCATCHSGAQLTDSGFAAPGVPRLHDVGTLGPGSGQRLGAPLTGLDTPTLHGLWHSAPYLHDGSAATLDDVLTGPHGPTPALTAADRADLVAYLLALDGRLD